MKKKEKVLATTSFSFLLILFFVVSAYPDSDSEGTAFVLNVLEPLQINSITITPATRMVLVNTTFNATMNATSGSGIDSEYALITLPNGSTTAEFLPMNYTAPITGIFNITFFANDTAGNIVNSSGFFYTADIFLVGTQKVLIQTKIVNGTSNETHAKLKTYLSEGMLWLYNFTCNGSCTYEYLSDFLYDYEHSIESALTTVTFRQINNSIDYNNTLQYQRQINPENGTVLVVAIDTNYTSYTSANLIMNYSDASYNYEGNLSLQKCSSWNFSSGACLVSWINVTANYSQNQAKNLFNINVTSFSAYGITQPYATTYCGDGTCNGAETGATCPADCVINNTIIITNTYTSHSSSTKTIETIIEKMIEAPEGKISVPQIYLEIYPGGRTESTIHIENPYEEEVIVNLKTEGDIGEFISFEDPITELGPGEEKEALFIVSAEPYSIPGYYTGNIIVDVNGKKTKAGVTVKVLTPSGKLLDIEITTSQEEYYLNDDLTVEIELFNLGGAKKVDVDLKIELVYEKTGEVVAMSEDSVAVQTAATKLKRFEHIFKKTGKYVILATATYISDGVETVAKSRRSILVNSDYRNYALWLILAGLIAIFTLLELRKPLTCVISENRIFVKNITWLPSEASMIFLVCHNQELHKKVNILFEGEKYDIKKYSGSIEKFFKSALKSGPIITEYKGKVILAIKNNKGDFLNLSNGKEFGIECEHKLEGKPEVFFVARKHVLSIDADLRLWNLLENNEKEKEYFKSLLNSLNAINVRPIMLKKYFENIISILR